MGEVRVAELGGEPRGAGGLGRAVNAVERPADSRTNGRICLAVRLVAGAVVMVMRRSRR